MDLAAATAEDFQPFVGDEFEADSPGGTVEPGHLRLVEVNARGRQAAAPRPEPFSLVFVGPVEQRPEQRIHRLDHPVLGAFELFLVPIGYDGSGGVRYEAVFN